MRHQINCIRAFIAMLFSALLLASPAYAAPKQWKISEVSGQVQIERDGSVRSGARGMVLGLGDAVMTGETGRAVVVRGGEYVIVSPKSRLRIAKPRTGNGFTRFIQYAGSVLFKIEKKQTPHFGVETPYLAAVVKGTTFNVAVTPAGATVQVTEGRVEVATLDGGAVDLIVPGRVARVDAGDRQLLKVLGTDAKTIRSPLPTAALPPLEPGEAALPASAADGKHISISATEPPMPAENRNDDAGFSGRIGTPVISEPVSLAVVTSGLISNGPAMNRNPGNSAVAPPAPPPVAATPAEPQPLPTPPANPGAGGTDNPATSGDNGGGNGNGGTPANGAPRPDPAPAATPQPGNNGGGNGNGGGNDRGNDGGNDSGSDDRPPADRSGNNGGGNGNGNNGNGNGNGGGDDRGNDGGNDRGNDDHPPADRPGNHGSGNGNGNNGNGHGNGGGDGNGNNGGGNGNGNGNGGGDGNDGNGNGNGSPGGRPPR